METHRTFDFRNQHFVGQEGRLIPLLQKAQETEGYLTRARLLEIHRETGIPLSSIYGVATFYAQFRMTPVGKNLIRVCHGTACHVAGAKEISETVEETLGIGNGETTKDRLFSLETVSCIGCCSLAPVIMINHDTHGNLNERQVKKVLKQRQAEAATAGTGAKA
ncbi:MAG TPA: NADH-quinone oxidoreductase subunit NuoE [Polyangia bacterium]